MTATPSHPRVYLAVAALWFVAVAAFAGTGQLGMLRPPVPQAIIGAITVALIVAGAALPGLRVWLAGLNLRQIVALHVTRFVGVCFLVMMARGQLPAAFALPAGWGDIAVAAAAVILVLFVPDLIGHRALVMTWNLIGLADILYAVFAATRLAFHDPASMSAMLQLPLALVPFFLVPIIIGSHLLLFVRLRG